MSQFSLLYDKADDQEIERRIMDGVELRGATAWILIFAIFVASIGLNVNSTAVIVGAMLISPLMGPIMGVGLGAAVYDFSLVKKSIFNLFVATAISLTVSATYFVLSPLNVPQSELLARTTPTLWDVLIAFFGGMAGIVGLTRQERSNVIPGVAIATALMPPVCTAGFGIAHGHRDFFLGALYLYTINCVFISLATFLGLRLCGLKAHSYSDAVVERRVRLALLTLVISTTIPSIHLASRLVGDEVFRSRAQVFVQREFSFPRSPVTQFKADPLSKTIVVVLFGDRLSDENVQRIRDKLDSSGLKGAELTVHQAGSAAVDVSDLKTNLLGDFYRDSRQALEGKEKEVKLLRQELERRNQLLALAPEVFEELKVQYPEVGQVFVGHGQTVTSHSQPTLEVLVEVQLTAPIRAKEIERLVQWLRVRTRLENLRVEVRNPVEVVPATTKTAVPKGTPK